jgi:hypothetical protein
MRIRNRLAVRAAVAAGVTAALAGGLFVGIPAAGQGTAPPWAGQDQNAVGGLSFFDASGAPVTSGSTSTAPFAAYAQGRVKTRNEPWTDTKAILYAYVPQLGQTPDIWSADEQIGSSSAYPNSGAPAALGTSPLPLNTGLANDLSLEEIAADFPNPSTTAGYENVYEIRMRTNAPQQTLSDQYLYADITVNLATHTWALVYTPDGPVTATVPGAPSGVHATAGNAAATVSWTAPAVTGGAAITGYDVQFSANSGATWTPGSSTFHTSTATSHVVTGLTNAKPYLFRVAAINSVGTGGYSPNSAPVTPVADPSSLLISATSSVRYGSSVTVAAKLRDAKTNGVLAAQSVALYRRLSSTAPWTFVRNVTTSSTGAASTTYKPTTNEQWQWRYAGTSTHKSITSPVALTSVVQGVSARANHGSIRHGTSVSIYGTVVPSGSGQRVYLQQLVKTTWRTLGTSATIKRQRLPNGTTTTGFVLTIKLNTRATDRFRVYKPATSTLRAGYSGSVSVKVT